MHTLEEMLVWSVDDILAAIRMSLPPGLYMDNGFDTEAEGWFVTIWKPNGDSKVELYDDFGLDYRLTLLGAYGWLWMRQTPGPGVSSPWQAGRKDITPEDARRDAGRVVLGAVETPRRPVPDPGDLDPEEILATVYKAGTKK